MLTQFLTIGLLMLLTAMLPGPDFALVTKNSLFHSRRSGMFTALGIGCAVLIHITYCALGLAIIITHSLWLFNLIKTMGAIYLLYLGIPMLLSKSGNQRLASNQTIKKSALSDRLSFRQGFLCNLLNPKATLFFLTLFTFIIKPNTPTGWLILYAIEMFSIVTLWFFTLTFILSHPYVTRLFEKAETYFSKTLGILFIGFGIALAWVQKQ
jgi:Putative threonine efflux protein